MRHITNAVEPTARILARMFHRHGENIIQPWAQTNMHLPEDVWVEEHWKTFQGYAESLLAMYHTAGVMLIDRTRDHEHSASEDDGADADEPAKPMTAASFEDDVGCLIDAARDGGVPDEALISRLEDIAAGLREGLS